MKRILMALLALAAAGASGAAVDAGRRQALEKELLDAKVLHVSSGWRLVNGCTRSGTMVGRGAQADMKALMKIEGVQDAELYQVDDWACGGQLELVHAVFVKRWARLEKAYEPFIGELLNEENSIRGPQHYYVSSEVHGRIMARWQAHHEKTATERLLRLFTR